MKNNIKTFKALSAVLAIAGLLAIRVAPAMASGSAPGAVTAGSKPRHNNFVEAGHPLSREAKGAKVFGVDTAATLVTDETGAIPTNGGLAALEIGNMTGGTAACYLLAYDSSNASDTTESGSVSRLLVPPFLAVTSSNQLKEFAYPKQFNKGLVVLMGGGSPSSCRATVTWLTNGGQD